MKHPGYPETFGVEKQQLFVGFRTFLWKILACRIQIADLSFRSLKSLILTQMLNLQWLGQTRQLTFLV